MMEVIRADEGGHQSCRHPRTDRVSQSELMRVAIRAAAIHAPIE